MKKNNHTWVSAKDVAEWGPNTHFSLLCALMFLVSSLSIAEFTCPECHSPLRFSVRPKHLTSDGLESGGPASSPLTSCSEPSLAWALWLTPVKQSGLAWRFPSRAQFWTDVMPSHWDTYVSPLHTCICRFWSFIMPAKTEGPSPNGSAIRNRRQYAVDLDPHLWLRKLRSKEGKRFFPEVPELELRFLIPSPVSGAHFYFLQT